MLQLHAIAMPLRPAGNRRLHVFRISRRDEIDHEFRAWLAEAYQVGNQEHLGA